MLNNNLVVVVDGNEVELDSEIMSIIRYANLENYALVAGKEIVKAVNDIVESVSNGVIGDKDFAVKFIETDIKIRASKAGIEVFHKLFDEEVNGLYEKTEKLTKALETAILNQLYTNL